MKKEKQDMRILVVSKKNIMNGGRVVHNRLSLHHESSLYLFNTSFLYRLLRLFGRKRQHAYATRVFTKKINKINPQVILFVSAFFMPPSFFEVLKNYPHIKKIGWAWDAFGAGAKTMADALDLLCCSDTGYIAQAEAMGAQCRTAYLPLYADETVFINQKEERSRPPFFAAVANCVRTQFLAACQTPCTLYGCGWDKQKLPQHDIHNIKLSHHKMQRFINRTCAPINICFSPNIINGLNFRVFEIGAVGGLIMVNETPDLALCYQLQTEAVTYRTAEDFARLIADIVATPDKYAQIAQAGYRRTMAEHTATKRVAQLMQLIDQCVHNY